MDKLSKESQDWISENEVNPADYFCGVMDTEDVKAKLLEMESKLKQAKTHALNDMLNHLAGDKTPPNSVSWAELESYLRKFNND